ncbi:MULTISPECIES: hypothetical protein [Streptomyces]|uniref:Uncharacterized protein n=1 Tax=Streptomyces mirabilis TaxID=68239 RepID=A0ABU3UAU6_9ACTN|nr:MULTISPECIES: hypothetical protein [Streptomyces]MCX4617160.1 hypothetical protein [Streptomyces mirabilis]MCX5355391.1 hypothetical protein [Streptomyces mirabilis]MDU8991037.1 hypothetical protein [Streptomyces mirabilis]QDN83183.1 hypothetical protein FNV64_53965 [Streptomyces sp. S1A1-7]QDN93100.1 hypothetical protein FNV61_53710 [Streptomyces sp. RLB3-6]
MVAELPRLRNDLRDTKNRLVAGRDELNEDVHATITLLRQEVQKVKDTIAAQPGMETDATAPMVEAAEPAAAAVSYAVTLSPGVASGETPAGDALPPAAAVGTAAAATRPPPAEPLPAVPAQRAGTEDEAPPAGLEEQVQQAVRAVLADELSTLHAVLAGLKDAQDAQATARDEQHQELTEIRKELTALAAGFEDWQAQQATTAQGAGAPDVTKDHSALLQQAARVSSAILICHRDMWEFITAHAGRHPHFRIPPQITDHGNERLSTTISGRSLIAVLISLYNIKHAAEEERDADWELATTLYRRIHHRLTTLAADGEPVTIAQFWTTAASGRSTCMVHPDDLASMVHSAITRGAQPLIRGLVVVWTGRPGRASQRGQPTTSLTGPLDLLDPTTAHRTQQQRRVNHQPRSPLNQSHRGTPRISHASRTRSGRPDDVTDWRLRQR